MPRRRRSAAACALLVATLALMSPAAGAAATRQSTAVTGAAVTSPAVISATRAAGMSYGDRLPGMSATTLSSTFADAKALGVGWVRMDFGWDRLQPTGASQYSWSALDRVVDTARQNGLRVLGVIGFTPAWARPAGCYTPKCAPASTAQFASFAAAVAAHYAAHGVSTWEVWNEANISAFWQPRPDPTRYADLLKATAAAVRRSAPGAFLISTGLSPAATGNGQYSPLDFLERISQQGANRVVNAVGFHPYSYPVPASYAAPWNAWQQMAATPRSARSILTQYATPGLPIWATEYGAPTGGPGRIGTLTNNYGIGTYPDHVDEALQAAIVTDAVKQWSASSTVQALFWYTNRDLGTSTATIENFFGLRRYDGSQKPSYGALRTALSRVVLTP